VFERAPSRRERIMTPDLEVIAAGTYASVQDLGRFGFRRIGVPWSGVLDRDLMHIANTLAGNPPTHPVIECFDGGQQFRAVNAPIRLALAGHATLEIRTAEGSRSIAAWRSFTLAAGDTLRILSTGSGRIAVLAVAGLAITRVMGSASTYARAGIGGAHGRALVAGDRLPCDAAVARSEHILDQPPRLTPAPIRAVPGPQHAHFSRDSLSAFFAATYVVSNAADRMGIRLDGAPIAHRDDCGHEIVSDAIVPGSIQVPGNGLPIVLLADAQTAGGYPKIATVISADLSRLAAMRPGDNLSFTAVSAEEGERIARRARDALDATLSRIRTITEDGLDLTALYAANLVDGAVNALAQEPDPPRRFNHDMSKTESAKPDQSPPADSPERNDA